MRPLSSQIVQIKHHAQRLWENGSAFRSLSEKTTEVMLAKAWEVEARVPAACPKRSALAAELGAELVNEPLADAGIPGRRIDWTRLTELRRRAIGVSSWIQSRRPPPIAWERPGRVEPARRGSRPRV